MARSGASVTGVRETQRAFKALGGKASIRVLKSATSKAATPIVKLAKKLVKLGTGLKPDGSPREHLRKTLTKTKAKVYKNAVVVVTAGSKFRAAPHAALVDRGTDPHDIPITKPLRLFGITIAKGAVIKHPGAKAQHFMERAGELGGPQAAAAMEKGIVTGIEREAAKLAAKK